MICDNCDQDERECDCDECVIGDDIRCRACRRLYPRYASRSGLCEQCDAEREQLCRGDDEMDARRDAALG